MKVGGNPCRVLLLGYGGANNTGADIRTITIIDDLRRVLGDEIVITVATLNRENSLRIIKENDFLKVVQVPYLFPVFIWRLIKSQDVVMLTEGSTFKDNWGSPLLYLFLWGAWCAARQGKACMAYAVEAGRMSSFNQWLTRKVCAGMDMIVTRTQASCDELRSIGVERNIQVTTDTAFNFTTDAIPGNTRFVLGCAPVEFNEWPVKFRLWGDKKNCYHWPYYFSWDKERASRSGELVRAWVELIIYAVRVRGWDVCLIAMESLDRRICEKVLGRLPSDVLRGIKKMYAGDEAPEAIVARLRSLNMLVTSRYHACVLSMGEGVPQAAFYHDERLVNIYREMGMEDFSLPWNGEGHAEKLRAFVDRLYEQRSEIRERLRETILKSYLPRCEENRRLLRKWWVEDGGFMMGKEV